MSLRLFVLFLFVQISLNANPFKLFNRSNGLASDKINCIVSDNQFLWLATDGGVNRLTLESENIKEVTARNTTRPVTSIVNDEQFLWVGIQGKGLYKLYKEGYILTGVYPSIFSKEDVLSIEKSNGKIIIVTESKKAYEFVPSDSSITELTLNGSLDSVGIPEFSMRYLKGVKNIDHIYVRNNELFIGRTKVENHSFDLSKPISSFKVGSYLMISNNNHLYKYSLDYKVMLDYQQDYGLSSFAATKYNGMTFLGCDKGLLLYSEKLDTLLFHAPEEIKDTVPAAVVSEAKLDTVAFVPEVPKEPLFSFDDIDFSIVNMILLGIAFVAYTVLLVWLTSFKYKRDIKTLEDELLRKMKGKGEV